MSILVTDPLQISGPEAFMSGNGLISTNTDVVVGLVKPLALTSNIYSTVWVRFVVFVHRSEILPGNVVNNVPTGEVPPTPPISGVITTSTNSIWAPTVGLLKSISEFSFEQIIGLLFVATI